LTANDSRREQRDDNSHHDENRQIRLRNREPARRFQIALEPLVGLLDPLEVRVATARTRRSVPDVLPAAVGTGPDVVGTGVDGAGFRQFGTKTRIGIDTALGPALGFVVHSDDRLLEGVVTAGITGRVVFSVRFPTPRTPPFHWSKRGSATE